MPSSMKKLYLSESDKKLAGVCGGIAEYMDVDSTVVRLLTVVLTLITGVVPLLAAYVVAWVIIPARPPS